MKAELVTSLIRDIHEPPTKIVVTGDAELVSGVAAMVDNHFNGAIAAMQTYDYLCEIGHPDGSKGKALERLAESLGVRREEVVAVGDSPNDVDMIQWAGLGVAMGNAPDDVKASADQVTLPASGHGLAILLESLLSRNGFAPLASPSVS